MLTLWSSQKQNSIVSFLKVNSKFLGIRHHSVQIEIRTVEVSRYLSGRTLQPNFYLLRINPLKRFLLNYISGKRNGFLAVHIILTKTTSQTIYNGFRFISAKYENITLIRDFNVSPEDSHMETFCESYGQKTLLRFLPLIKIPQVPLAST